MSIKRRMRRLEREPLVPEPAAKAAAKGKAAAKPPEEVKEKEVSGLPERKWPGLARNELRLLLAEAPWPVEELDASELTATLESFRSWGRLAGCWS